MPPGGKKNRRLVLGKHGKAAILGGGGVANSTPKKKKSSEKGSPGEMKENSEGFRKRKKGFQGSVLISVGDGQEESLLEGGGKVTSRTSFSAKTSPGTCPAKGGGVPGTV